MRRFDEKMLEQLRNRSLTWAMKHVGFDVKEDTTFKPIKDKSTRVFYASRAGDTYEILATGPKWVDKLAQGKSGGGCIDLVMYLRGVDFVNAVKLLTGPAE